MYFELSSCFKWLFDRHHARTWIVVEQDFGNFNRWHLYLASFFKTEIQRSQNDVLIHWLWLITFLFLHDWFKKWKIVHLRAIDWILRCNFITGTSYWINRVFIGTTIRMFHLYSWELSHMRVPTLRLFHFQRYFLEVDFLLVQNFYRFWGFWSYAIEFCLRLLWWIFVPNLLDLRQGL